MTNILYNDRYSLLTLLSFLSPCIRFITIAIITMQTRAKIPMIAAPIAQFTSGKKSEFIIISFSTLKSVYSLVSFLMTTVCCCHFFYHDSVWWGYIFDS